MFLIDIKIVYNHSLEMCLTKACISFQAVYTSGGNQKDTSLCTELTLQQYKSQML